MLSLTHIFLYNWHRFTSTTLEIEDSLYLTGLNGAGKSTILDAIQVVLLADLKLIKFNSSAQEKSQRTIDGFVRGKVGETRLLRPGNCIGYIALEFTDTQSETSIVVGCCIEAGESIGPNGERTYFILHDCLDTSLFVWEGQPRTRSQLKKILQKERSGRYYDSSTEYQIDLLVALGNLHFRFFDRFRRALSFTPITNVNRFVEEWLLNEHPLHLENLLLVVSNLEKLAETAKIVEAKVDLLTKISDSQKSYQRFRSLQGQFEILHSLLQKEEIEREVNSHEQNRKHVEELLRKANLESDDIRAALQKAKDEKEQVMQQFYGLDVVNKQQALHEKIQDKKREADALSEQKKQLIQDLHTIETLIYTLLNTSLLEEKEKTSISHLYKTLTLLSEDVPISSNLPEHVDIALEALKVALDRIRGKKAILEEQILQAETKINQLEKEIANLQKGASIAYPDYVEKLRDRLQVVLGQRPVVLCEMLEVPDESWQTAVEALLGERRFLILVPPNIYEHVLDSIEEIKKDMKFHNAGVLDLEKAYKQRREAQSDSLAQKIMTGDPLIQAYIHSILGNVITCTSAQEVREFRRAITPDLVYYNEWVVRILPSDKFRIWFVGSRARISQIEARQQEKNQIKQELSKLIPSRNQAGQEAKQIDEGLVRPLLLLRKSLNNPPEDGQLRLEIVDLIRERDALDMSRADQLKTEIQYLSGVISTEEDNDRLIQQTLGNLSKEKEVAYTDKQKAEDKFLKQQQRVTEIQQKYSTAIVCSAEELFQKQKVESSLIQLIANAEKTAKGQLTKAENAKTDFRNHGMNYNIQYSFAGLPEGIDDDRYQKELERLKATELPQYKERITEAKNEAEQELKEHVLHILRERIINAQDELIRMNDALKPLTFHDDRYQFRWQAAEAVREYHDLIVNSQMLGTGSLFESTFYQDNQETFDKFYRELTTPPKNDIETKNRDRLLDYRTYLEYDIEIKHQDSTKSRLSRIAGETSGGETQTPFYIAVAASFVQLYHIMDAGKNRRTRPTIRLAVFDEAFNRMDQDRIGVALDMLQQFGLQIITATPLERSEYLVPKICTNLVLTRVRDQITIDEYSNYAAKLQEKYAGEDNPSTGS